MSIIESKSEMLKSLFKWSTISEIRQKSESLQRRTHRLGRTIANLLTGTSLEPKHILDKYGFLKTWESYQDFEVQHKFQISLLKLEHFSEEFEHFEERLKRIESKKLIVDVSQLKSLGLIPHFQTHSTEEKLYDKLFQIFVNQIMPHVYRFIEVPTVWSVSKLITESNTLEGILYKLNSLFNKLDDYNIYDCIGINSTLAKYINMDESDESGKFQLQQPNSEYWNQLLRISPVQKTSKKNISRLSEWIEENIIICSDENINGKRFYSIYEPAISSTMNPYTPQELDPIFMLSNTLQRTRISKNSLFADSQRGRATIFSHESNNNQQF